MKLNRSLAALVAITAVAMSAPACTKIQSDVPAQTLRKEVTSEQRERLSTLITEASDEQNTSSDFGPTSKEYLAEATNRLVEAILDSKHDAETVISKIEEYTKQNTDSFKSIQFRNACRDLGITLPGEIDVEGMHTDFFTGDIYTR